MSPSVSCSMSSPMFPQNITPNVMFNVILCVIMIQSHKYQATLLNGSPKPPFNILNITIETTPLLLLWCRTWHHKKTLLGIRWPILKTVFPETLVVVTIRPITDATRMSSLRFPLVHSPPPALFPLKLYPNTNISDTRYYTNITKYYTNITRYYTDISDTNICFFCTSLTSNGTDSSPF